MNNPSQIITAAPKGVGKLETTMPCTFLKFLITLFRSYAAHVYNLWRMKTTFTSTPGHQL